jgi:hypothetical protein
MVKLSEIFDLINKAQEAIEHHHSKKEWFDQHFPDRLEPIYKSIRKEKKISMEEFNSLPPETEFESDDVRIFYESLWEWLRETIEIL